MSLPIICITMGDPAGVGPEIIVKALQANAVYGQCHPLVVGDAKRLEQVGEILGSDLKVHHISDVGQCQFQPGIIDCVDLDMIEVDLPFGVVHAQAGHAAFAYLAKAIELANTGAIDAICTAPLNKEALHKAGHLYPGHTEILADLTNTQDYAMMLTTPQIKVIHATTHQGLVDSITSLKWGRVYKVIRLGADTLQRAGQENPRIAVCGINPHAGENGLFGSGEEESKVVPAIEKAQTEGLQVSGPHPADTVFYRAMQGDFDMVVAMYHDQGHIPIKVLGFEAGVNVTVGLPIVRTSVDHGTAFDIAGQGIASDASLRAAIDTAVELAPNRRE